MGGTYHCYCAICSAPLHQVTDTVGSSAAADLQKRWDRIDRIKALRAAGEDEEEEEEEEEDGTARYYDETHSYDPTLLGSREKKSGWIVDVRCLGFNESALGGGKAFLSGCADYDDSGHIEVDIGNDPNQPKDVTDFCCYFHLKDHEIYYPWGVFPVHQKCFCLLCKVITGSMRLDDIDKDLLYSAMDGIGGCGSSLNLDYGNITGPDQDWINVPGEEFSVSNPVDVPDVSKILLNKVESQMFKTPSDELDLGKKVVKDPFADFPYDIIHALSACLPAESLLALINASWSVRCVTRHNSVFWKGRISSQMAWFWELQDVIRDLERKDFDFQRLYFWLEKETAPTYGMRGPFLGIANRRRIWKPCEQIAEAYFKKLRSKDAQQRERN